MHVIFVSNRAIAAPRYYHGPLARPLRIIYAAHVIAVTIVYCAISVLYLGGDRYFLFHANIGTDAFLKTKFALPS